MHNHLQNQDFLVFNQIVRGMIQNLKFVHFTKQSDKSRFALSMPTLTLSKALGSTHQLRNISFTNSQSSFLSVSQVALANGSNSDYNFLINDCEISNNTLTSKDSLVEFGEINYKNFLVTLDDVDIKTNSLELGTMFGLKLNCKQMLLKNSNILNNKGQFASLEPASSDPLNPLMFFLNNTNFTNNYAKADALIQLTTNSIMKATYSLFLENYSVGRGSIVFADYQGVYALFEQCEIVRNYAYQGGAFYIQYSSQIEVSNCTIKENFAVTGGVAYVNNDGLIKINKATRVFNNSALNTCFLFLINTQFESLIDSITVTQNDQVNPIIQKSIFLAQTAKYKHIELTFFDAMRVIQSKVSRTINEKADSSVYAIKAKINFTTTDISKNDNFLSASTESIVGLKDSTISNINATGKIIQAVSSSIELINIIMHDITYYYQNQNDPSFYKISIVNKSFLRISGCTMTDITGLLLYVSGSTLIIDEDSLFEDIVNDDRESSMLQIDSSTVTIDNSMFNHLQSNYYSPIISMQENTLTSVGTTFKHFDKSLMSCEGGQYTYHGLTVTDGQMTLMPDEKAFMVNSIVFDVKSAMLTLNGSSITGIISEFSSPAIYIEDDATSVVRKTLTVTNCMITDNQAEDSAGAIYSKNTNVFLDKTQLLRNTAKTGDAGALYLDCEDTAVSKCVYLIQNSLFINNTAKVNGGALKFTYFKPNITVNNTFSGNLAEYGSNMASYPVQMLILETPAARRQLGVLNATETAKLNITDGVVFQIDDPLVSGSLVSQSIALQLKDDETRQMITDNTSVAVMSSVQSEVQVMKSKSVRSSKGIFTFDDVIIIGPPGQDILLKVNSDSIKPAKIEAAFTGIEQQQIYVKAYLRLCDRGEYQSSDNKCILCSDGFFTLKQNQTSCAECPENAVCQEGYKIIVDEGYWRKDVLSTNIYECYNLDACLGGYEVACAKGYGGNLCQSCVKVEDHWYSRESANDCSQCIEYSQNSWRLAGVSILVIVYFIILIWIDIRSHGQQKLTSVYMRILTNYFQILTLAQSYDLSWDDNLKKFLEAISFIAKSSEILLSIDCFVRDNGIQTHPVFVKMIIACTFPIICMGAVFIFWMLLKLFKPKSEAITNLVKSVIIIIFMSLPPITSITFAIYNCVDIFNDGDSYLALDMDIQCWEDNHSYYAQSFGIPIILIWVLGLPIMALVVLFFKRKSLHEQSTLNRYGFLYIGLNPNAFYWEILLHFRKVLLISVNVFFTTFKPLYRALIGFMLMIIYIEFLQKVQPYQTAEINDLEFKANIAAFATFYGGLFFISEELPFGVTVVLFIIILVINGIFIWSWFKLTFSTFYGRIHKWLGKYFACFRKTKAETKLDDLTVIANNAGPDDDNGQNPNTNNKPEDFENEKSQRKNRSRKNKKALDDSSRYALAAVNESNRESERPGQNQDSYFMNGLAANTGKEEQSGKKKKRVKAVEASPKKAKRQVKEIVKGDSSVSNSSNEDEPVKDKKDKKQTRKNKKKESTGEAEAAKSTGSKELIATDGRILGHSSSNNEEKEAQRKKAKKRTKVVQNNDEDTSYQQVNDQSLAQQDSSLIQDQQAETIRPPKKHKVHSQPLRDEPVDPKHTTIRAFNIRDQSSKSPTAQHDNQAKVHTVKYKGGQKESTSKDRSVNKKQSRETTQTARDQAALEQKRKIMKLGMQTNMQGNNQESDGETSDFEQRAKPQMRHQAPSKKKLPSPKRNHVDSEGDSDLEAPKKKQAPSRDKKVPKRNMLDDSSFSEDQHQQQNISTIKAKKKTPHMGGATGNQEEDF